MKRSIGIDMNFPKCLICNHFLGQHIIKDKEYRLIFLHWNEYLEKYKKYQEGCYIEKCGCHKFVLKDRNCYE